MCSQNFEFCERLSQVQAEIGQAVLVAATKTVSVERLKNAEQAGLKIFGENRVQELLEKYEYFPNIEWHMIGHLQTNKVKCIIDKVKLIHSVDTIKLLGEIELQAAKIGKTQEILLEVNVAEEESKSGFLLGDVEKASEYAQSLGHIKLKGLMAMMPNEKNLENNIKYYLQMRQKYDIMKGKYNFEILSMGMSADYHYALRYGANMVRIGSGLFGERNY